MRGKYDPSEHLLALRRESDPFRILASGTEAAVWLFVNENSNNAAEAVMTTYSACVHQDAQELATSWLVGLAATAMWPRLITQDFFVSWLKSLQLTSLLVTKRLGGDDEDVEAWRGSSATIQVPLRNENHMIEYCEERFKGLMEWVRREGARFGLGGYNALVAVNRTRWRSSSETVEIGNPAAFGFVFALDDPELPSDCLQKQIADNGQLHVRSVTLGTKGDGEDDDVLR